jgi:serine/threonine protein phosphatase 1
MSFELQKIGIPRSFWRRQPSIDSDTQLLAIGDVHGRTDLLIEIIEAFHKASTETLPPASKRKIVLLGDIIDRGPGSLQALRSLFHMRSNPDVVMLMGNHEATLLECLDGTSHPQEAWLHFGGEAFLRSLSIEPPVSWADDAEFRQHLLEGIGEDVVAWLRRRPAFYTVGDYYFCHAGVRPGIALERQIKHDLMWIREPFLRSRRYHGKIIVHGHSVEPSICIRANRIGVDTGAHASGVLTGLVLQGDQAWSLVAREQSLSSSHEKLKPVNQVRLSIFAKLKIRK